MSKNNFLVENIKIRSMSMFSDASYHLKYRLRKAVRWTPAYRKAYRESAIMCSREQQEVLFWKILRYAVEHVPYYSEYRKFLDAGTRIKDLPLVTKENIAEDAILFVSDEFNYKRLLCVSTGGTTGTSTNIYTSWLDEIRQTAYTDAAFDLGRVADPVICTIREHDLGPHETYRFWGNRLMLSPSNISRDSLKYYVDLMRRYKVNILHCYPSSLMVFCKLLQSSRIELDIKAVLVSSEIVSSEVKHIVGAVFPRASFINLYAQTENVARGISLNSAPFEFMTSKFLVEFLDIGERRDGNIVAEIVGTNLEKKSMPLIRFATGDYAVIDPSGRVIDILGRTSEYLIDKFGSPVPCIVVNRPNTMDNVFLAQYYQDKIGEFEYRIMVNDRFGAKDIQAIKEDIQAEFGDKLTAKIHVVKELEKTSRGKHRKLIQKLDLSQYL